MSRAVKESDGRPRVLVTRASGQASALAEELQRLGAEPISVPIIEVVSPDSFGELDAALAGLSRFDWLLFTSANAVQALTARAKERRVALDLTRVKIAAIGSATASALASHGFKAHLIPGTAVAEALCEALLPFARQPDGSPTRFLLVRAQEARELLPETLRAAGGEVTVATAYKTQTPVAGVDALLDCFGGRHAPPDGVTLTSSSAARSFLALLATAKVELDERTVIASIGPITTGTLVELGHPPHVEAREASVQALAESMMMFLKARSVSRRRA